MSLTTALTLIAERYAIEVAISFDKYDIAEHLIRDYVTTSAAGLRGAR